MEEKLTLNQTVRESISQALVQLMSQRDFSEISVREIAEKAGVSRSSFYRNYRDKEEVLLDYITQLYNASFVAHQIAPSASGRQMTHDALLPRFRFIRRNRLFFTLLHRSGLLYRIFEQIQPDLMELLCGSSIALSPYHLAMCSGACAGIVRLWIENDFRESEEELARIFMAQQL